MRTPRSILLFAALAVIACGSPEQAWELAEREDSNEAYLQFLAKYPEGEYADRARARILALKELRSWERAQFRDRVPNYQRFISEYPDSEFAPTAQARISELERADAWEAASEGDDRTALENFLARYPEAPEAAEARTLLAALQPPPVEEPPPARPGDFRVQVGAFRTAAAAETELRRLAGLFPDVLLGPVGLESPAQGDGRFLLKTVPMSWTEAESACGALRDAGQDCFIVNR